MVDTSIHLCDSCPFSDSIPECWPDDLEFGDDRFGVQWGREFAGLSGFYNTTFEIIGNAHDNPALLGAGEGGVAE